MLADGQNHPGFGSADDSGLRYSCEGELEPTNSGTPGKADGCYATQGDPQDDNPAID